ncbi:MAG: AMP-binding protein, partial [Gammaproteobacteria bacterium]
MATVIDLIWEHMSAQPNRVALRHEDQIITYSELAAQVDALTEALCDQFEQMRRPIVAVLLERSLDQIICLLSILKAGLIILPLDPHMPAERNTIILEHARADLLILDHTTQGTIALPHNVGVIELNPLLARIRQLASTPHVPTLAVGGKPAALIYTNADPESCKGVTLTNAQLHDHLITLTRRPGFTHEHSMGLISRPSSPWALTELFLPLIVGGCACLLTHRTAHKENQNKENQDKESQDKESQEKTTHITHLILSAHALHDWLTGHQQSVDTSSSTDPHAIWPDALPKHVWIGGEILPQSIRNFAQQTTSVLWRFCHIPEAGGWITAYPINPNKPPLPEDKQPTDIPDTHPLGPAMPGVHMYLHTPTGGLAGPNEVGVLWVGGSGLTAGYHNEAGLTATTFTHPSGRPNERRFNTGLKVSKNAHGFLSLHQLSDDAVTLYDYRLELREIENRLDHMLSLERSAIKVIHSDDVTHVVAVLQLTNNFTSDQLNYDVIRQNLADALPDFLIPAYFHVVPEIPVTSTGIPKRSAIHIPKLDMLTNSFNPQRETLAHSTTPNTEPDGPSPAPIPANYVPANYVAPEGACEKHLVHIFEELLGQPSISVTTECRELADSITLATFCQRLRLTYLWRDTNDVIPLLRVIHCDSLRQLAAQLIPHPTPTRHATSLIPIAPRDKTIPLSGSQLQTWYVEHFNPGSPINNITFSFNISGELQTANLEKALHLVVNRHEILQCAVSSVCALPTLTHFPSVDVPLMQHQGQNKEAVTRKLNELHQLPIPLQTAPLMRCALIKTEAHQYVLGLAVHRLIWDEFSTSRFIRALANTYNSLCTPPGTADTETDPAPINYHDYAQWQRNTAAEQKNRSLTFWRQQLSGAVPRTQALRTTPTLSSTPTPRFSARRAYHFALPHELQQGLTDFSKQHRSSVATVALLAYFVVLARYTDQADQLIGYYTPNRPILDADELIGPYATLQPVYLKVDPDCHIDDALAQLRLSLSAASEHQHIPFDQLVHYLNQGKNKTDESAFLAATFIYHTVEPDVLHFGPARLSATQPPQLNGGRELHVALENLRNRITATVYACETLIDAGAIERFMDHFTRVLHHISQNSANTLAHITLLSPTELSRFLYETPPSLPEVSPYRSIAQLISQQAQNSVDKIAVVAAGERITYPQLEQRSNQLAHTLMRLGLKAGDRCAVCLERNTLLPITFISIWKCGASVLPIDPNLPIGFNKKVLQHAEARFLLVDPPYIQAVDELTRAEPSTTLLTRSMLDFEKESLLTPKHAHTRSSQSEAYVFYVAPGNATLHGIGVPHQAVICFLNAIEDRIQIKSSDQFLSLSPVSFDDHLLEFWLPLMVGATLFIQDCPTGQNGLEILGAIEAHGITALQARPDVWSHIMTTGWSGNPELTGLIGGSSITPELIDFLSPRLKELWFCYGTTESTVWNTTQRLHPHTPAGMIGQPLAHSRVYILNAAGQAMAEGWTGDVYIGGACLTHGYLKNRLETKARFVELALENGATVRLLRTGDRARWQANGVLEYQGRTDRLVKIAGYRTDLSEIEQCIETMHKVHRAVVRAVSSTTSARTTQLIAYVEPTPESTLTPYDITHYLKRLLPIHSIPQQICCPVHIPFNQNAQPKWSQLPSP